ncbi:hypothetical protein ACFL3Q_08510 [Planctomycetota bacterium]
MPFRAQGSPPQCHFERSVAESRNLVIVQYQPYQVAAEFNETIPIISEYANGAIHHTLRADS